MHPSAYEKHYELDCKHFWRISKRRLILELVDQCVRDRTDLDILDIGGACSLITKELSQFGYVLCLEPDQSSVTLARSKLSIDVIAGSLPHDVPVTKQFGLITLLDVLEHIDDDKATLDKIYSLMEPGGYFICTVPAYKWLWSSHDVVLHHKRRYAYTTLKQLFLDAGFHIERLSYYCCLVFPVMVLHRVMLKLKGRHASQEYNVRVPPIIINTSLTRMMDWERRLLKKTNLPFGSSLFAVCRKP